MGSDVQHGWPTRSERPPSSLGCSLVLGGGVQEGGARVSSAQRGVKFSVVSLVLFLFLFVEVWGGLVGVVALCGGKGRFEVQTGVCIHRRGREEGPSQLVCTVTAAHTDSPTTVQKLCTYNKQCHVTA